MEKTDFISNIAGGFLLENIEHMGGAISCWWDCTVSCQNSVFAANKAIKSLHCSEGAKAFGGGISIYRYCNLQVLNVSFIDNQATTQGGAIYIERFSTINMSLSSLSGNKAEIGAGLAIKDFSQVEIEQSQANNNSAKTCGSILAAGNGVRLTVSSSAFYNNKIIIKGGNLYAETNCSVAITNCSFADNVVEKGFGGAVLVTFTSKLLVSHTNFVRNAAGKRGGGAIAVPKTSFSVLDNCSLSDNIFGGILVEENSFMEVKNCKICNNTYIGTGGAIFVGNGTLHLLNVLCEDNTALLTGGVLHVQRNSRVTFDHCNFINNKAHQGGVVYAAAGAIIHINNSTFKSNNAWGNGGALAGTESIKYFVSASKFSENSAPYGGAILFSADSKVHVSNCEFTRNSAELGGGAIRYQNSELYVCIFENNTGAMYGGGAIQAHDFCDLEINDSIASGNKAIYSGSGGPIIIQNSIRAFLINVTFSSNATDSIGGAIAASYHIVLYINNSYFYKNQNDQYFGGAIYMEDNSIIMSYDCIFEENMSEESACIYIARAGGFFENCIFIKTTVQGALIPSLEAGALHVKHSDINIANTTFTDNVGRQGGAMKIKDSSLYTYESTFINNNVSLKSSDEYFEEKVVDKNIIYINGYNVNTTESPYACSK